MTKLSKFALTYRKFEFQNRQLPIEHNFASKLRRACHHQRHGVQLGMDVRDSLLNRLSFFGGEPAFFLLHTCHTYFSEISGLENSLPADCRARSGTIVLRPVIASRQD